VWCNGESRELPTGVMPLNRRGSFAACWNDINQRWNFGESDGRCWNTVWNSEALPAEFRVYLLVMGIPT
jgi:hypothetical protein